MGLAIFAVLFAAGLILSAHRQLKRVAAEPLPPPSPVAEMTTIETETFLRTTAHEAGHALVGWFSTIVADVTSIEHHGYRAITMFTVLDSPSLTSGAIWEVPRLYLSGIAAERLCFGDFEAEGAMSDITTALQAARKIIAHGCPGIEYERNTMSYVIPAPDFAQIYPMLAITPDEDEVLRLAYTKAAETIIDNNKGFLRLWRAMVPRRNELVLLSRDEIMASFGPRLWAPK